MEELKELCRDSRIKKLHTPYNRQHNSLAERKTHTIMEERKKIIHDKYLAMHLWGEASRMVVYVKKNTPHRVL